jgi:ligand-binding sensor domain-containing protein
MKQSFFIICIFISLDIHSQVITNYDTSNGLVINSIECIDVDINNNIWIGTSTSGIQKFDGNNWTTYNIANSNIVSNNIKVIKAMTNGDIWIGTEFGLSRYSNMAWSSFNSSNSGIINNWIKSIDEDINSGLIWFGTSQGASSFEISTNAWVSYDNVDLHWSGVSSIAFDSQGDVWFSHLYGGITHYDGFNFTRYDTADGLLSQNATSLVIDNQDNKWIGTGGGISVLNSSNTVFNHYTKMYLLPPPDTLNPVVEMDIDISANVWVAIYVGYLAEGGVAVYNGSQWQDFDVTDGLVGPNIRGIVTDNNGNAWVATSSGISKISLNTNSTSLLEDIKIDIYPNPSKGKFYISIDDNNIYTLCLYNNLGQKIFYDEYFQSNQLINLEKYDSGVFYLQLYNKESLYHRNISFNK